MQKLINSAQSVHSDATASLGNVATGQATSKVTQSYLLNTLKRGQDERDKFQISRLMEQQQQSISSTCEMHACTELRRSEHEET